VLHTNQLSERLLCVRAWMECYPYFLQFLYSLDKIWNRIHPQNILSSSKFHENQCWESHTLLRDVDIFTHVHSTFIISSGEIWYMGSENNVVEHLWVLWKFAEGRPCFLCACKWYCIYMCTDILSSVSTSTPLFQHHS
jgi:hypothetical protein